MRTLVVVFLILVGIIVGGLTYQYNHERQCPETLYYSPDADVCVFGVRPWEH